MAFGGAWNNIAKALGEGITLVAPDMPSHGKSADWDGVSDFSETVFRASIAALDTAPMDVVGHSFGAATALRMAVEHPDRIRSLTLFEPVFFAAARAVSPEALADDNENLKVMEASLRSGDHIAAARAFNRMWATGPGWDTLPERAQQAMARAVPVVPATRPFLYDDTCDLLGPGRMEAVGAPTLVMRGALSLPVIVATNKGLANRLGNAQEVVIEDAGHMAPISHPAEVAEAIGGLLARS
jgi:pimeloyl-ACP methyl ester carboxylesterase